MDKELREKMIAKARENGDKHGKAAELDFGAGAEWMYEQLVKPNAALPPVNVTAWVFDGKDTNGRNISIFIEAPDRESAIACFESNYEGYRYWQVRQLHLG